MKSPPAKIVVMDDEDVLTALLQDCLNKAGYRVVVCSDALDFVKLTLAEKPDLAVIDYMMPSKTGTQLLSELRKHSETKQLPVLFLSGTETLRFSGEVPPEPHVRFLSKPVEIPALLSSIAEMLDSEGWSASA